MVHAPFLIVVFAALDGGRFAPAHLGKAGGVQTPVTSLATWATSSHGDRIMKQRPLCWHASESRNRGLHGLHKSGKSESMQSVVLCKLARAVLALTSEVVSRIRGAGNANLY